MAESCKSVEYIPIESVRTEYVDKVREIRDTFTITDKQTIYINGDTVRIVRYVDRYNVVSCRDTCYIERTDSIAVPFPVERKLSWWEQKKIDFGGFALSCVVVLLIVIIWLIKRRM